jgi:hypothetical protein
MISTNERKMDEEDAALLFWAMCKFGEANEEEGLALDISLVSKGFAEMLNRASMAAGMIGFTVGDSEGDNWDGVVWAERFESIEPDSLAARLFMLEAQDWPDGKASDAEIESVVVAWLAEIDA